MPYQAALLLEKFTSLPPGRYEQIEKLEQLRVLENGFDIMVGLTEEPHHRRGYGREDARRL